ncbi:CLUMA_CG000540, isoform A [Clunio marinus]|uniref:Phospholipid-transporting ATPase n=1 Tax=Clunio marinus TaxID=568069 RepID=A0A1J1HFS6_9DIPT|nr:CLUMA_CG000540, isoform A [Clunio marinus]
MTSKVSSESVEMELIKNENSSLKPLSAPPLKLTKNDENVENKNVLFRRSTGSKKQRRKAQIPSSSSLHSLVPILKASNSDQRSVPNVSFDDESKGLGVSKNSLFVTIDRSIGETSSQFNDTTEGGESSQNREESFSTQTSSIGFRASFFSVLEKLGVLRSQDLYKPSLNSNDTKLPPERKTARSSITSLYMRTFYGENDRRIRANDRDYNSQFRYANNFIKTSKYSLLTFLPLNLLEQFQRLANFYFFCLLILQLIPAISSLTPVTTAIPLIGVLSLTAIKDAYDDFQRHLSDSQVNNRISKCLRNGKLVNEKWAGVQVGDIIRMENDQFVAADILLLTSSEPNGLCFIETAELDGETNLKIKQCLVETAAMSQREDLLWQFNGEIICEPPNNHLNKFEGTLMWRNQRYPLDNEKVLLRGCVLRNTQWCYGMVIFAGKDTKLMQNSGKTKFKRTNIDKLLNFIIIGIVFFLLSICGFCTVAAALWEGLIGYYFQSYLPWERIVVPNHIQGATVIGMLVFFSYAIVLNTVVPISLYVSVEVIRFAQSFQINWDEKMFHKKSKTFAKARTTTLNEELGQIQYIFSDKTGTLTQNIMTFNKCSIAGRAYGDIIDLKTGDVVEITEETERINFSFNPYSEQEFKWYDRELLNAVRSDEENAHCFFRLLALCHTVMPDIKDGNLEYQAQSPDEAALVSAARNFGFVFKSRTPSSISIDVKGKLEEYELLNIIDFNNTRKRMSVILRRNNKIILYCKGADNVIYERLGSNQNDIKNRTQEHLNKFAGEGLRTLVLAERIVDESFYNRWRRRQQDAAIAPKDREDKLEAIYEEIESDMRLIGVTAIEDKLQDGVAETIANLQTAGIKIWVLTGDKQETAINIGYSCQLLTDDMVDIFVVDGITKAEVEQQLRMFRESIKIVNTFHPPGVQNVNSNGFFRRDQTVDYKVQTAPAISIVTFSSEVEKIFENSETGKREQTVSGANVLAKEPPEIEDASGFAIVINGHSLVHCLAVDMEQKFLEIASQCRAVICCRVTPLQKALVVALMKRNKNAVTLAIGDGANDVSMIKEAHIGVGISGQEGMQAVLASDYSIAQFRYLERLLLVHGRWSYYRMCKFLRYFFYKNFAFTLCHFWYAFFCGFSAQTVFDPMFISVYNLFYTSLPVLALGVFEQDVSDKHSLEYPKLYTPGLTDALFNTKEFVKSVIHGVFSSLVLFLIPYGAYRDIISPEGHVLSDHMLLGAVVAMILVLDNTTQIALDTSYWTIFNHITIWGSLLCYLVLDSFYNYVIGGPYVGSLTKAIMGSTFWFTTILTVITLMVPVLAWRFYTFRCHPSLADKIRMKQRKTKSTRSKPEMLRTPSARRSRRSLRSSYAFAHEEGFGRLITSGKLMRKLPQDLAFPLGLGSKKQYSVENETSNGALKTNNKILPGSSNSDLSPRAPLSDLDTINL